MLFLIFSGLFNLRVLDISNHTYLKLFVLNYLSSLCLYYLFNLFTQTPTAGH